MPIHPMGAVKIKEETYEDLWDKYSEYIDTDLFSLQQVAGSSIITRESYSKLVEEVIKVKMEKPELFEEASEDRVTQNLRKKYRKYWNTPHKVVLSYPMWLEKELSKVLI